MARRKSAVIETETAVAATTETDETIYNMGEFKVIPYIERRYSAVYYGIREMYGQVLKKRNNNEFDWQAFNSKFEECFGKVEDRKHSIEELEQFAFEYFEKTIEEVVEYNRKSLNRRKERESNEQINIETLKPEATVKDDNYPPY